MKQPYQYGEHTCPYCGERHNHEIKLAQAWVPYQRYRCFFNLADGWDKGTIFMELYQPYRRRG